MKFNRNRFSESFSSLKSNPWVLFTRWLLLPSIVFSFFLPFLFYVLFSISNITVLEFLLSMLPQTKLEGVNILVYGIDDTDGVKRSDAILVVHLNATKNSMGVLSIPRDTRVKVDGIGFTKINHAYAYGGVSLLRQTVSEFLSVPIQYHMGIDIGGVETIINELGGIDLDIDKDLYYVDYAADLVIDLKKGRQHLDGKKAMEFLRYRHDSEGDIGRIRRHQAFLQSLSKQMVSVNNIFDIPTIVGLVLKSVKTDLSKAQMLGFAAQFREVLTEGQLRKGSIPGAACLIGGVSYWRPDMTGTDKNVEEVLLGFETTQDISGVRVQTVDVASSKDDRRKVSLREIKRVTQETNLDELKRGYLGAPLKVEVLNGYGKPKVAAVLANYLKENDFPVLKVDNAGSFNYDKTLVVDWKGRIDDVVAFAQFLHIDPAQIIVYDRPDKTLDTTVVLGRDWEAIQEKLFTRR